MIDKYGNVSTCVGLNVDLYETVRKLAFDSKISLAEVVRNALKCYLEKKLSIPVSSEVPVDVQKPQNVQKQSKPEVLVEKCASAEVECKQDVKRKRGRPRKIVLVGNGATNQIEV